MEKVKSSRELLEKLISVRPDPPHETAMVEFAKEIGACTQAQHAQNRAEYGELFHNCLDIINLRQQFEQSDVLSKQSEALFKQSDALLTQSIWIRRYTYATFALVGVTFVLAVITALIAIFR
jgi:hypothetical protein